MSPRAACRFETLGFDLVFDYVAGKVDWVAAGLPVEGRLAMEPRAGDAARSGPPTCGLSDRFGEAQARMEDGGWDVCVVVNDSGCVLGELRLGDRGSRDAAAEAVMRPGPWTQRPHVFASALAGRMRDRGVEHVLVSEASGVLLGVLYREDVERLEGAARRAAWEECEGCPGVWRAGAEGVVHT